MLSYSPTSRIITSSLLAGVTHGFGTRMTGDGSKRETIADFLNSQHVAYKTIIDPDQVHSDKIVLVKHGDENVSGTDGLITKSTGLVLTVVTADCLPIIYLNTISGIIGISHQGWKGTDLKLAGKMVNNMKDLGSKTYDLRVAIGPGIGACCYGRNLLEENYNLLMASGLKKSQIDYFPFCTKCDSIRFFSYRGGGKPVNLQEQFSFILLS